MKPTKCLTYVLCLAAVLVTTASGQLSENTTRQPVARAELRRALDSFAEWTGRNANRVDWPQNIQEEGLKIAKQRRAALAQLIETDPAQALSNAVSARVRGSLPPVIQGELENSVSGFGDLLVLCAIPSAEFPASGGIQRVVRLDGRTYRAMVYGRGLEQSTTFHTPLHGIELDGVLALDSDVFSPLTAPKVASRPFVVPVTGQIQSKALVIRVDFSDMPGDPRPPGGLSGYSAAAVQDVADNQVAPYYRKSSYGKVSVSFTVTTQLYRLPGTATHYATSGDAFGLYNDALAVAAQDFALTNYDKLVVVFSWLGFVPGSQLQFGGLSSIGSSMALVNGEFDFRVVAHELGHCFGLYHANFWHTSDNDPASVDGSSIEYGDLFDTMGANMPNDLRADFNPWFKYLLGWLPDQEVQSVQTSGIYRVYRFDDGGAQGTLALKVHRNYESDFWIGFRRNYTENAGLQHGAYVVLGYHYARQSNLLGLGASLNNSRDPGLAIGTALNDLQSKVAITPLAQGGESPHEYLDVSVALDQSLMFSRQPESQTMLEGFAAQFSAQPMGSSACLWQRLAPDASDWQTLTDGTDYQGTATPTLQISAATMAMDGDQFRCVLSDASGGFNSSRIVSLSVRQFGVGTLAGQSGTAGTADGPGSAAQFNSPQGITLDAAGSVFVADTQNQVVRKITSSGVVSSLAGLAGQSGTNDGLGSQARFNSPTGLATDQAGNLYVADQMNCTIRKITPDGLVATLAGLAGSRGMADGTSTDARFNRPAGLAVDCFGTLFVADTGNNAIRMISPDGTVSTVAGFSGATGAQDGPAASARFNNPSGIAVDGSGNLFVADTGNSTIRRISIDGTVSTVAGAAGLIGSVDGTGSNARFNFPSGLACDSSGNIYVADRNNSTIRQISISGEVSTLAGAAGAVGVANGIAKSALFNFPEALVVNADGVLFVADSSSDTIRLIRTAVTSAPMLRLSVVAGQLVLSWPNTAANYTLETCSDVSGTAGWRPVATPPSVVGCNFVLTNDVRDPTAFFRLRRH